MVRPLRARVVGRPGGAGEVAWELPLGLMATGPGRGRLAVRVRAVVCARGGTDAPNAGVCRSEALALERELVVSP
jgi:hypothetical protein